MKSALNIPSLQDYELCRWCQERKGHLCLWNHLSGPCYLFFNQTFQSLVSGFFVIVWFLLAIEVMIEMTLLWIYYSIYRYSAVYIDIVYTIYCSLASQPGWPWAYNPSAYSTPTEGHHISLSCDPQETFPILWFQNGDNNLQEWGWDGPKYTE